MITVKQLQILSAVIRLGSVTAAARELNVSQPTASKARAITTPKTAPLVANARPGNQGSRSGVRIAAPRKPMSVRPAARAPRESTSSRA